MAELKTQENDGSVVDYLNSVENEKRRRDSFAILQMMEEVTGLEARMWGDSIVGFGSYHYKYESGREGDWFITGFAPRKRNMPLYIMPGFAQYDDLLGKLGKYTTGVSCLYINKLEDVKMETLRQLVKESVDYMEKSTGQA